MLKYLRIAVTALSLTACVLLVALWVRSYWWSDEVGVLPIGRLRTSAREQTIAAWGITAGSERGTCEFTANEDTAIYPYIFSEYIGHFVFDDEWEEHGLLGFNLWLKEDAFSHDLLVETPHWFWVFASAMLAATPWLPYCPRFSLRTLLIATTLVAVGLAAIVYR
jgi:hypothetical protein